MNQIVVILLHMPPLNFYFAISMLSQGRSAVVAVGALLLLFGLSFTGDQRTGTFENEFYLIF